jgi:hypothetical protein
VGYAERRETKDTRTFKIKEQKQPDNGLISFMQPYPLVDIFLIGKKILHGNRSRMQPSCYLTKKRSIEREKTVTIVRTCFTLPPGAEVDGMPLIGSSQDGVLRIRGIPSKRSEHGCERSGFRTRWRDTTSCR